jgi:hypothetical protein
MSLRLIASRASPRSRHLNARAGPSSRLFLSRAQLSTSPVQLNIAAEIEKQLNPRELIERKRKLFEQKYGEKLNKRVEQYVQRYSTCFADSRSERV